MARTYLTKSPFGGAVHLFIATSAYQFHPNYTHSLAAAVAVLAKEGIAVDLCHIAEHCHVDDARNAMVREFLMSDATHLVFIDNDVGFYPDSLVKLARHEKDMVAGVYPLKEEEEGYPIRVGSGVDLQADENGLVEVEGLPTGFLKISRSCLEKMVAEYGDRKFYGRGQSHQDIPHVILFERTYQNGVRYSGDYAFCEKWKAIGGKMYVDPEMYFTHSGTHEWSGTLGEYWRKSYGVNAMKFDSAISQMKQGRFNAEIAMNLIKGWDNPYHADMNTLVSCWQLAKKSPSIIETGSGLSTIVMALANPECKIISLDSGVFYAQQTQSVLDKYEIGNVTVKYVPLVDGWYDYKNESSVDLIVLDGPNRKLGNRNKAFERLNIGDATVLIDDADDESLLNGFKEWAESVGRNVVTVGIKEKTTAISLPKEKTC